MTFEDLFAGADRIAGDLFKVSAGLDANIFRIDNAGDRGALTNLQRLCHDTAIVLRAAIGRAYQPHC